jgi:ABC-type glycerol-3-phosphate transport system substrate-binding protein
MAPMAERTGACSYGDPWMWPHMWGFAYITKDEKYEIDRPETIEFLNVIKEFSDSVGVEKVESLNSALQGISRGAFGVGKQAMQITYPSGPKAVWTVNPTQNYTFTYVPVPAGRKGKNVQTAGGHAALLMKDAKHHEQSFRLSAFLAGKETCDILFAQIGWLGPRKSWQQGVDMSRYPEHVQKSIKFFTDSMDTADEIWYNTDPIESITETNWQKNYQAVQYGQSTPDEAAKAMQDTLTTELAKALEQRG